MQSCKAQTEKGSLSCGLKLLKYLPIAAARMSERNILVCSKDVPEVDPDVPRSPVGQRRCCMVHALPWEKAWNRTSNSEV